MEGLVSFLKKQKPRGNSSGCFSKSSTKTKPRCFNKLIRPTSLRRARSHSQPPSTADLASLKLAHSRSLKMNNVDDATKLSYFTYGSRRVHSGTYQVSRETSIGSVSQLRHQNSA